MGRALVNATVLQIAAESGLGVQPTSGWKTIEPTTIEKFGSTYSKTERRPISKNRQKRKGALTDLDSSVEFTVDTTYDHLRMFASALMFSVAQGTVTYQVTSVTSTGYVVAAAGDLPDDTLIYARGFRTPANNGLKETTGTSTTLLIKAAGLSAEASTAARGAIVEVAGIKGAAADLEINASGDLKSTVYNWTTGMGALIELGQFIHVGYEPAHANSFALSVNRGLARVTSKTATVMTLDKKATTFAADPGTGKSIYILFGTFIRNVPVDDGDYLEQSFHLEAGYENLGPTPGDDMYEYAKGNFLNSITLEIPVAGKSTMKCSFVGTDCDEPTGTRATGASTATPCVATTLYNTSADMVRLRVTDIDQDGIATDFKSLNIMIGNSVTPEKVIGTLGGKYMNAGMFDVEMTGQVLFTSAEVIAAMRNNETVTMEVCLRNDDGGFILDIPAMTIEGGDKEFPVGQTITVALKAIAFQDPLFGYSLSISTFPHLPVD